MIPQDIPSVRKLFPGLRTTFTEYLNDKSKWDLSIAIKNEEIIGYIENQHKEYLEKRTSPLDDCYFIISVTISLLKTVFTCMNIKVNTALTQDTRMIPVLYHHLRPV